MPYKPCYVCGVLVPAREYAQHKQRHANAANPRRETPEERRAKQIVRKRDGDRCVICRRSREQLKALGLRLEVHHKAGPNNNDPRTMECRCEEHHPRGGHQPY